MKPGGKYWAVLEPIWDEINIDTPEMFAQTFGKIPRDVGLLYAAHFCQSEVCNGGFTQLFWNSTGVLAPEAADGFIAIGQPHVAEILQRAMDMLGSPFRRERAARWSALDSLRDTQDEQSDQAVTPRYRNIDLFRPLEREFYSTIASEGGGFNNAADAYAERLSGTSPR